jgi:hypothetical protein
MKGKKPTLRRSGRSHSSSGSPRTQFNRGGAPAGNENAKKSLAWLDTFDLATPEGIDLFLREVVKATWESRLGTRAAGALNGSLRLLLEHLTLPNLERRITELEKVKTN